MKLIALTIIVLLTHAEAFAQKQETLAKFKITEATNNGEDISQWYFERKQYMVFYKNGDGYLCFANVSGINNEQSHGWVFSLRHDRLPESDKNYQADFFTFRWKYYNTYDFQTGYATVSFVKLYKAAGVAFYLKMVLPYLDVLEFNGYMEGSLNLNDYLGN